MSLAGRAAVSERELLERAVGEGSFPQPRSRALGGRSSPSASRARAVVEAPFSPLFAALVLFLDLNSDETTP